MATHMVNTHQAKSQLSDLIRKAEQGHEVIVARNGKPAARIIAWEARSEPRTPGQWSGRIEYYTDDIVSSDVDVVDVFIESEDADLL